LFSVMFGMEPTERTLLTGCVFGPGATCPGRGGLHTRHGELAHAGPPVRRIHDRRQWTSAVPLSSMWRVNVRTLSAAERALWDAFPRGRSVDLTGRPRAEARTIRAEVIAALLLGARAAEGGRIAAVRLTGARIAGTLELGHGVITVPVRLASCDIDGVIDLTGAKTRDIDLSGSGLAGLAAPLVEVDGNLGLSGCACSGAVVLSGAHITGSLDLQDARLAHPAAVAFLGNRLTIDNDLVALRARVDG
jgi:hypothetical protein